MYKTTSLQSYLANKIQMKLQSQKKKKKFDIFKIIVQFPAFISNESLTKS